MSDYPAKHRIEDATPGKPVYVVSLPMPIRTAIGVWVLNTRTAQFTGYFGQVDMYAVPLQPHDMGLNIGEFDGTCEGFLATIALNRTHRYRGFYEQVPCYLEGIPLAA